MSAVVMTKSGLLTAEEFFLRDDFDSQTELVIGEVIQMPPADSYHGTICVNIADLLKLHAKQHDSGHVFSNDGTIITERTSLTFVVKLSMLPRKAPELFTLSEPTIFPY